MTFTAQVQEEKLKIKPTFNWTVSAGEIIRGQGTSQIKVKLPGAGYQSIKATVEVGGYSPECGNKESAASPDALLVMPHKVDEFGDIYSGDMKARLDNFAVSLLADPTIQGYFIYYGGRFYGKYGGPKRLGRRGEIEARANWLRDYMLNQRGFNPNRIVMVNGGFREEWTVQLWLVPREGKAPVLTPTVQPEEIEFMKEKVRRRRLR